MRAAGDRKGGAASVDRSRSGEPDGSLPGVCDGLTPGGWIRLRAGR